MSQVSANKLLTKPRRTKLNASNMSEDYGEEEKEDVGDPGAIASSLNEKSFEVLDVAGKAKQRIPVTFFSGMPVLGQPSGTMPLYPSWSVHALGKYFSYSHSSGMALPGFLRGSHFLLPWDVQLSRPASLVGTPSKTRVGRPRDSDSVKLFIGFEMECPMGHRFFLAGPDRPMTGTMQGGDVRRSVSSLLSCDLALYLPCRCSPTAVWAQLMRIYVAIPSVAIRVRFAPMVRPGPMDSNTPIFHLGPTLDREVMFPWKCSSSAFCYTL
ncbi:Protein SMG8 [Taenia solium]|eukprot:TsM_000859500 transcript=TsM_000859500 gene=TsM_000859500